jgi:hypothetical protein
VAARTERQIDTRQVELLKKGGEKNPPGSSGNDWTSMENGAGDHPDQTYEVC